MAQGDGAAYNDFKEQLFLGTHNLATNSLKVALVTGYTPNIDTHVGFSDISASEVSGPGYTAGGEALASVTVVQNNTSDRAELDALDTTWTGLNVGTPSHAVLYNDTAAGDLLIAYWEVTTPTNGGDYTLQWGGAGILTLT